jgi:hypothetical protein
LPGPDQSARGLAQSKTLARMTMALVNAKRLGLRWPSTAFLPRRGYSTFLRKQNRQMIYGHALIRIISPGRNIKMGTGATPVLRSPNDVLRNTQKFAHSGGRRSFSSVTKNQNSRIEIDYDDSTPSH